MPDVIEVLTHACGCTVTYETPADWPLRETAEQAAQRRCSSCDGSQSQYPDPFHQDSIYAAGGEYGLSPDDVDEIHHEWKCDFYGWPRHLPADAPNCAWDVHLGITDVRRSG